MYHEFILYVLQPTNAQIYITIFSLYLISTPTCFDTSVSSSGRFRNLYFTTLHQFLELELLKLQFHKTIRWKLFGRHWVIQYSLCDVTNISWKKCVYVAAYTTPCYCTLCAGLAGHFTRYRNVAQTILYHSVMTK